MLLVCPACRNSLWPGLVETRLLQIHRIDQFRGVRRSFINTFAALLDALIHERPDVEAWRTLSDIAAENQAIVLATDGVLTNRRRL